MREKLKSILNKRGYEYFMFHHFCFVAVIKYENRTVLVISKAKHCFFCSWNKLNYFMVKHFVLIHFCLLNRSIIYESGGSQFFIGKSLNNMYWDTITLYNSNFLSKQFTDSTICWNDLFMNMKDKKPLYNISPKCIHLKRKVRI